MGHGDAETAPDFEGLAAVAGTLKALDFACSMFDDSCDPIDVPRMAEALARLSSLQHLGWSWYDETYLAVDVLSEALPSLKQLTSLTIDSFIETSGPALQLAAWPPTLVELRIEYNGCAFWIFNVRATAPQLDGSMQLNTLG